MSIALSGGPNAYRKFTIANAVALANNIAVILALAGWAVTPVPTGGFKAIGTSPQSGTLSITVFIHTSGGSVSIQFTGPGGAGFVHWLDSAFLTFQMVANPCQFFISVPGVYSVAEGTTVCGGIPFLPPDSLGGSDPDCTGMGSVTECWWSAGDWYGSPFFYSANPRSALNDDGVGGDPFRDVAKEGMFNGVYVSNGSGQVGTPQLNSLGHSGNSSSHIRYPDGSPLLVDPLICWGDTAASSLKVRGQIWDALIVSESHPMDDTTTVFTSTVLDPTYEWINFTNQYYWGALYLIMNPSVSTRHRRYVY